MNRPLVSRRIVGVDRGRFVKRPYGFVRTKRRGNAIWCNASNRVKVAQSRVVRCDVDRNRTPSVAFGATSLNFALTRKREALG